MKHLESASFMSPKDSERNGVLEDLSEEMRRRGQSSRRDKNKLFASSNQSTNQSGAYSVRGLTGISM